MANRRTVTDAVPALGQGPRLPAEPYYAQALTEKHIRT
jgi:hypothetical protein